MKGHRVQKNTPKRNPLFVIFIVLCISVLALLIAAVILGAKLKAANRQLEAAEAKLEQYEQGTQAKPEEAPDTGRLPGDDAVATDPSISAPAVKPESKTESDPATETEVKIGWLDLTGHKEVQVTPKSVFDKYYTYYTTDGVNLRGGPGTSYERIRLLDRGTEVKGAAKDSGWTLISVDGKFGWVNSDYLSTTRPEPKAETPKNEAPSKQSELPEGVQESADPAPTEEIEQIPGWLIQ